MNSIINQVQSSGKAVFINQDKVDKNQYYIIVELENVERPRCFALLIGNIKGENLTIQKVGKNNYNILHKLLVFIIDQPVILDKTQNDNYFDIVKSIIEYSEDKNNINKIDRDNNQLLHLAAKHANVQIIDLLLDNNAGNNFVDKFNKSSLELIEDNINILKQKQNLTDVEQLKLKNSEILLLNHKISLIAINAITFIIDDKEKERIEKENAEKERIKKENAEKERIEILAKDNAILDSTANIQTLYKGDKSNTKKEKNNIKVGIDNNIKTETKKKVEDKERQSFKDGMANSQREFQADIDKITEKLKQEAAEAIAQKEAEEAKEKEAEEAKEKAKKEAEEKAKAQTEAKSKKESEDAEKIIEEEKAEILELEKQLEEEAKVMEAKVMELGLREEIHKILINETDPNQRKTKINELTNPFIKKHESNTNTDTDTIKLINNMTTFDQTFLEKNRSRIQKLTGDVNVKEGFQSNMIDQITKNKH